MGSIFCVIVSGTLDIVQLVINILYSFWGIFGVTTPVLSDYVGSIFGCNL